MKPLCTTDDPSSTLEEHRKIRDSGFEIIVAPAFRPDRARRDISRKFNPWLDRLAELAEVKIDSFGRFIECLWKRHQFFTITAAVFPTTASRRATPPTGALLRWRDPSPSSGAAGHYRGSSSQVPFGSALRASLHGRLPGMDTAAPPRRNAEQQLP